MNRPFLNVQMLFKRMQSAQHYYSAGKCNLGTTRCYHFIATQIVVIKKADSTNSVSTGRGKMELTDVTDCRANGITTLGNCLALILLLLRVHLSRDHHFISKYLWKRNESKKKECS